MLVGDATCRYHYFVNLFGLGQYSSYFIVGLTDVSPETTAVALYNYDLCAQYPTTVPDAVDIYMECDSNVPARRYLVVQRNGAAYVTFCEIQVYIHRKSTPQQQLQLLTCSQGRPQTFKNWMHLRV